MQQALETITLGNGLAFNYSEVVKGSYIEYNGIRLIELQNGFVKGELDVKPELLNPNKILHGGVFGTLADTIAIFGCIYAYEVASITTVNLNVAYLKPVKSGTICAKARMLSKGKSISHWEVEILDENEELLATASVAYFIKK